MHSGNDNMVYPLMLLGASGVISVFSNLFPKLFVDLVDHCLKGQFEAAKAIHFKAWDLMNYLMVETNPIPIKEALFLAGEIRSAEMRLPLVRLSKQHVEPLRQKIEALL